MATTWFEQGVEKGRLEARRDLLRMQLEELFGSLSPTAQERLASWPEERLVQLGRALLRAKSLGELGLED